MHTRLLHPSLLAATLALAASACIGKATAECSSPCASGQTCINGTCLTLCNSTGQCPVYHECRSGSCVFVGCTDDAACDDLNECTADSCSGGGCQHVAVVGGCEDGDRCTFGDTCQNGVCVGTPLNCDDGKGCTVDTCNPETGVCGHPIAPIDTICRPSSDACDAAEVCDGISPDCPADLVAGPGTPCREAAGACDFAETCDGADAVCPTDRLANPGTVCRAATGPCDAVEVCSGTEPACPADGFEPPGTVCRPSAGGCDVTEVCNGASVECPIDAFSPSGTICRMSAHTCDPTESCDGTGPACPADSNSTLGYESCSKYGCSCYSGVGAVACCLPLFNTCKDTITADTSLLEGYVSGAYHGTTDGWSRDAVDACIPYTTYGETFGSIEVPTANLLRLTFYAAANDAIIYLVDDCAASGARCGPSANLYGVAGTELLEYYNSTGMLERWFPVFTLGGPLVAADTYNVAADIIPYSARGGSNGCSTLAPVLPAGNFSVSLVGMANAMNANAAGTTCPGSDTNGADLVFRIILGDQQTAVVTFFLADGDPALYLMTNCAAPTSCIARSDVVGGDRETVSYFNTSGVAQTIYLVVDGTSALKAPTTGLLDVQIY